MKKIVLALFTMLFVSTSIFAQADLQVLAVVKYNKSDSITVKQLKKRVKSFEIPAGQKLSVEDRKEVLDIMIREKLLLQAAKKAGYGITESDADQIFVNFISQMVGASVTEKDFEKIVREQYKQSVDEFFIDQTGMNKAEYKEQLKNTMLIQQYILSINQEALKKVSPTDSQIRDFYDANRKTFSWNDMVKVFLVAVPKGNDPSAAKVKLNELRNKCVDNKLSEDKIITQAQVSGSGYQAGMLLVEKNAGFASGLGISLDELKDLFGKNKAYTTAVIETPNDYRFIRLMDKYNAKMLSLSDIVQPESTVTVYEYIRMGLTNQLQAAYIQKATAELAESLNTSANVEYKKTGDALDKLLDWGD